jgi:rubrerythrin
VPFVITPEIYRERCAKYGFTPVSPYVSVFERIQVTCNKHKVTFSTTLDKIKSCKCPQCIRESIDSRMLKNEDIDKRLGDRPITRIGDVNGRHTKIEWGCKTCDNHWFQTPGNVVHENNPTGCPKCDKFAQDDLSSFKAKLNKTGRKDLKIIGEYFGSTKYSIFQCNKCEFIWRARPANILNLGRGCPTCKLKSERMVGDILKELSLQATHNYYIKTPQRNFLVDWIVETKNIIIEYNGLQHYSPRNFGGMSDDRALSLFKIQQERDISLREYCKEKNVKLIEIDGRLYNYRNPTKLKEYIINTLQENGI